MSGRPASDQPAAASISKAPPPCPSCDKGFGRVRAAEFGDGQRTLTYVCDQCRHTWTATEADRDGLFGWAREPI